MVANCGSETRCERSTRLSDRCRVTAEVRSTGRSRISVDVGTSTRNRTLALPNPMAWRSQAAELAPCLRAALSTAEDATRAIERLPSVRPIRTRLQYRWKVSSAPAPERQTDNQRPLHISYSVGLMRTVRCSAAKWMDLLPLHSKRLGVKGSQVQILSARPIDISLGLVRPSFIVRGLVGLGVSRWDLALLSLQPGRKRASGPAIRPGRNERPRSSPTRPQETVAVRTHRSHPCCCLRLSPRSAASSHHY